MKCHLASVSSSTTTPSAERRTSGPLVAQPRSDDGDRPNRLSSEEKLAASSKLSCVASCGPAALLDRSVPARASKCHERIKCGIFAKLSSCLLRIT